MENKFKVGDVVRFKNGEQRKIGFNKEQYVIEERDNRFVVVRNDKGEMCSLYADRFELVEQAKQEENFIKEGAFVKAVDSLGVSLVKGNIYHVESFDGAYVKLKGIRNRIRAKFFVPCEAPVVDDGEELLKELKKKVGDNPGTCSYVLEFECGYKEWHLRDVCHARLRNCLNPDKIVKQVALNVSGHYERAGDPDAYAAHVQYIIKESPFKECFLPRPIDKILETGVLLDISKPYSQVVAAAIALRSGSEFPSKTKLFKKAIDIGFSGNVASILSTFFNEDVNNNLTYNQWGGGHHYINSSMKVEHLVKFYEEGFHINLKEKSYKEGCGEVFTIFASIAEETYKDNTFHALSKTLKGGEMKDQPGYWQPVTRFEGKNALVKAGAALSKYF